MCHETVNRLFFVFCSIPDGHETQEICDRVVSNDPFMLI